jgi:ketosteroid isomerase-like protein
MTQASQTDTLDLVLDYHRAWTSGDLDGAMARVADDFVCRAPGEELVGKEAYRRYLAAFIPVLTGIEDIGSLVAGDHVALFYRPQTEVTASAVAAEYFTVRDGQIVESVLAFDRLSYAPPER